LKTAPNSSDSTIGFGAHVADALVLPCACSSAVFATMPWRTVNEPHGTGGVERGETTGIVRHGFPPCKSLWGVTDSVPAERVANGSVAEDGRELVCDSDFVDIDGISAVTMVRGLNAARCSDWTRAGPMQVLDTASDVIGEAAAEVTEVAEVV